MDFEKNKPHRNNYQSLRETENKPKPEQTSEPKQQQAMRSAVEKWSADPSLPSQERSAINAIKIANQMHQQRQGQQQPSEKPPEKSQADQMRDKQAAITEDARAIAKENSSREQQQQQKQREH